MTRISLYGPGLGSVSGQDYVIYIISSFINNQ